MKACPTGARLFGDIKDPLSEVSIAIRERGGYALMPEWNTRPANHYLPRRPTPAVGATAPMPSERDRSSQASDGGRRGAAAAGTGVA